MKFWLRTGSLIAALLVATTGGYVYWRKYTERIPDGIVWGNGRVEADEIDITPKFAGRVASLLVDEGDLVQPGQVLARMDTRDLEAAHRAAVARIQEARKALDGARADVRQRETQLRLAELELERAQYLAPKDFVSRQVLDQRLTARDGAQAQLSMGAARVQEAEQAVEVASKDAERIAVDIADGVLVAPRVARVQYRLVNTGEVVGAGAKIFTLLDVSTVYMTVFLPTAEAGKVAVGTDARIILDAYPKLVLPAAVSFVAAKSQFTPKTVETRSERDKLMFRIKVRIDPKLVALHAADVRTGLPGDAYIRVNPTIEWPERFRANAS